MMQQSFQRIAGVVAAVLLSAPSVFGQTFDWINTGSGTFSNPANWSPAGGPPGPTHTARFALGSGVNSNVTFSGNTTVNVLTQNSGNVTFFLNGFAFQANAVNFSGMGADNAVASLRLVNGSFQPAGFTVGGNTGSMGTLRLDSTTMTVNSGVFQVGNNGTGTLIVQNGSQLTTSADTRLATNANGAGTATVNGNGSSWNIPNSPLRIGINNDAEVNVLNGGTITAHSLEVGEGLNTNGALNVSGAGATFTSFGNANIGGLSANQPAESALLSIDSGATVNLNGVTNFRATSTLEMAGGALNLNTVNVAGGADANWTGGTIAFSNGSQLTPAMLDFLLDGTHILGTNQVLAATGGVTNLTVPLAVNGGTLSANQLIINAGLSVGAFGNVIATDTLEIGPGQVVEVENFGSIGAESLGHNNDGHLILKGPNAKVTHFFANNFGVIEGTGRFVGGMNNGIGGIVRAAEGEHLIIESSGLTNPGVIELAGGTVEYEGALSNLGNGFITGRGTFRGGTANPGSFGLSNIGVIALSGGFSDFYGDVNNSGAGRIVAAGARVVTFHDDVTHNGIEIRTNAGSRSVFFGAVTGAGPFTGTGVVESNGDLRPGNSPGLVTFEGDLVLGSSSTLNVELRGLVPGSQHDQINVAGSLSLDGGLTVSLLDGFVPEAGNEFDIMDWGSLEGAFDQINLPTLDATLQWDVSDLYESGHIRVISVFTCPADLTGDNSVGVPDLLQLLAAWGNCSDAGDCPADLTGDGSVGVPDLLDLLANWGLCGGA